MNNAPAPPPSLDYEIPEKAWSMSDITATLAAKDAEIERLVSELTVAGDELIKQDAEIERLRKIIADAPHEELCNHGCYGECGCCPPCICWNSKVTR